MSVSEAIHTCVGCSVEGRSAVSSLPEGWSEVRLLRTSHVACPLCSEKIETPELVEALVSVLQKQMVATPVVGDKVVLLADGGKGKFKGREGVVEAVWTHDSFTLRVPGAVAPGEGTREYCGSYLRSQFRVVRDQRPAAPEPGHVLRAFSELREVVGDAFDSDEAVERMRRDRETE